MNNKYIRFNIIYFFITYILLCGIIFFTSYKFFLTDFLSIEKEQNRNNVETLLNVINKNIEALTNTTNDYSNWDESYEFMKNKNKKYIYENFREGAETLNEINLDSIMYLNLKNKVIFSQYGNDYLNSNKKDFENYLIEKFKNSNSVNSVVNFNSKLIYIFKSQVKRSDKTGENVGYIFTSKLVDIESISKKYAIFQSIKMGNAQDKVSTFDIKLDFLKAQITVFMDDNYLENNIQFLDDKGEYIISLVTTSNRDLIKNSKKTIMIFNLIVMIAMFFVLFFIYKNQNLINNQNDLLKRQVERKTKRIKGAYKKISEKNKELFQLANVDSLTKIRNRRNYFIESNNLLEKAIFNDKSLDVLMIDIDDFKKINDRYGHAVGDEVLIAFCNIVNNIIDKNVLFGRIGGEEFCLTFYDKEEQEVLSICEAIRYKCASVIFQIAGQEIFFTISMGLSSLENSNDTIDKILHRADEFLYEAKKRGKNSLMREVI